jgi:hypothetical protein
VQRRCSVEPYLLRVRALRTLEHASARCERHGPRHTNYACAQDTATLPRATLLTLRSTSDNNHFYPNTTTNKPNPFTHPPTSSRILPSCHCRLCLCRP